MLNLSEPIARREFLVSGTLGLLGLRSLAVPAEGAGQGSKACIFIVQSGGLSHVDSFDPKPDAPREVRSPFRAISTAGGFQITEIFPRHAAIARHLSLVRSIYHTAAPLHDVSMELLISGRIGGRAAFAQSGALPEIASEPLRIRERYGCNPLGERFLAARKAVERGERMIFLDTAVSGEAGWDVHGARPFSTMADMRDVLAPRYDRAFSALVEDLDSRGMLETTLVAAVTEFGRTPWRNADGGRDHWAGCWSACFAGGGVEGGRVIGRSDEIGAYPVERPVQPGDILATVERAMDFAPGTLVTPGFAPIDELF